MFLKTFFYFLKRKEKGVAKKLFVGNLPYSTSEEQLTEMFAGYGNVESANIVTDKFSGRSRGFGFVEMSSDDEAQKAITELNGKENDGRKLIVNEARPKQG